MYCRSEKYENQGRCQIINALNVGACRMSHRPDKQYANECGLHDLRAEQVYFGLGPMHINPDLPKLLALILWHPINRLVKRIYSGFYARIIVEVIGDLVDVLFSFAHESVNFDLFVDGHVIAEQTPNFGPYVRRWERDARPRGKFEFVENHERLVK